MGNVFAGSVLSRSNPGQNRSGVLVLGPCLPIVFPPSPWTKMIPINGKSFGSYIKLRPRGSDGRFRVDASAARSAMSNDEGGTRLFSSLRDRMS